APPAGSDLNHAIKRWLTYPVSIDFTNTSLEGVIDTLRACQCIPVEYDLLSMQQAGVRPDTPVTVQVRNGSTEVALKLVLQQLHLGYVLRDGRVIVASEAYIAGMAPETPVGDTDSQPQGVQPLGLKPAQSQETASACPKCEEMHARLMSGVKAQ